MAWWLVTWTTYGTWLPGDPRGFQTWRGRESIPPPERYARPGERIYNPDDYSERYRQARQAVGAAVVLDKRQQALVTRAVVEEVSQLAITPAVLSVHRVHVHFLAGFGACSIRTTVGRLKATATRQLHDAGNQAPRVWSRNCHMKSLADENAFRTAFEYVRRHEREGASIYIWKT